MPSNLPTNGALEAAVGFAMATNSSLLGAAESSPYSNYFSISAAPLDRYTDALVAEIGSAEQQKPQQQSGSAAMLPASSAATAAAAAVNLRREFLSSDQPWGRWRRKRRVTFADEVGLQLERFARESAFYTGSGEESQATSPVGNDNNNNNNNNNNRNKGCVRGFDFRPRRSTVCGYFFSRGGSSGGGGSSGVVQRRGSTELRPQIRLSVLHLRQDGTLVAMATVTAATVGRVFARMTLDNWRSYRDVEATFSKVQDGCWTASDTAICSVELLEHADQNLHHQQLEFCLCLQQSDAHDSSQWVWDSNCGRNYRLQLPVLDLCPVPE